MYLHVNQKSDDDDDDDDYVSSTRMTTLIFIHSELSSLDG